MEINRPGAAQWAIENSGRRWTGREHDVIPHTTGLMAMARFWEPRGRHVTVSLMDGDRFARSIARRLAMIAAKARPGDSRLDDARATQS